MGRGLRPADALAFQIGQQAGGMADICCGHKARLRAVAAGL